MIVRVQGSGQYKLAQNDVDGLQALDRKLVEAVHAKDEIQVHQILDEMIALVQSKGIPLGAGELVSSDTVLPHDAISIEEVQSLLQHESLVGATQSAG
ncbi:MAG: hypothetical protein JWO59_240 [Chloroflexi bacterium]|nr:hypothetical protein [Chloroflexota bacterium]